MRIFLKTVLTTLVITSFFGCSRLKFSDSPVPNVPKQAPVTNKRFALVLGGGGAKGFAHVGVLEELDKAGIVPDMIIGCSAGAIVGSLYAANPDIDALKQLVLKGKKSEIIETSFDNWPHSIYSKKKLIQYLRANLKTKKFAKLKIPFIATATNLQFGNLTSFSTGDMIDPIVASAAYPGALAPVMIDGQYYVDCGVSNPVPVRVAKDLGFEKIVAVNIAEKLPDASPNHMFGTIKRSMEIAYVNQAKSSAEAADIVIDFNFKDIGTFTDDQNDYLYKEGRKAAKKALPAIQQLLKKG